MGAQPILLLGNEALYRQCEAVTPEQVASLAEAVADLHATMAAFQTEHGWGRAIAAPQIGVHKRIVAVRISPGEPRTLYNPTLEVVGDERFEYWEDCMSFPELLVRIDAPTQAIVHYRDEQWREREARVSMDYAGLFQHELDHLDGVLAVQRALDKQSFALRRACPKDSTLRGEIEWVAVP